MKWVGIGLVVVVLLALAAMVLPGFVKFKARSAQSECKVNLKQLYAREKEYFGEHDTFTGVLADLDFQVEPGNRYAYVLGKDAVIPVDLKRHPEARELGVADVPFPIGVTDGGFVAACVGNVDDDPVLDVWKVTNESDRGTPTNVVNDDDGPTLFR